MSKMSPLIPVVVAAVAVVLTIDDVASQGFTTFRARDPGVRTGTPGAGGPLAGLTPKEVSFFDAGKVDFSEAEEIDEGLGPTMNLTAAPVVTRSPRWAAPAPP